MSNNDNDDKFDIDDIFGNTGDSRDDDNDDLPSSSLGSSRSSNDRGEDAYNPFGEDEDDIFGRPGGFDDEHAPRDAVRRDDEDEDNNDYVDHSKSSKFDAGKITGLLKSKKVITGVAVIVIILVVFKLMTSCGGGTDDNNDSGAVEESSVSTEEFGGGFGDSAPRYRPIPPEDAPVQPSPDDVAGDQNGVGFE